MDSTTLLPGMQCTVWGADRPVLPISSSGSMTLVSRGARGSVATSTMWTREERNPGTIRLRRSRSDVWHADEHTCQP